MGLDRVCDTPSQACLLTFHLPRPSDPPLTPYITLRIAAFEVHPARDGRLYRRVRSKVCRGIYRRPCSATSEGHFRTLAMVLNTLFHATLGTSSVSLLNTPSGLALHVSVFPACRDARYCANGAPSFTTFCEVQYTPRFIPGKQAPESHNQEVSKSSSALCSDTSFSWRPTEATMREQRHRDS